MAFTKRTTDLVIAILLTNSITFSLLTVASKRVLEVPSDAQFGLLTSAPVVFWMGLSLAALAVALSVRRSRPVFLAATSTLFLIWTGLPAMILDYPYRLDANRVSAIASNLLQSGFIDFSRVGPSYLQFPGFVVLAVQTSAVSGLSSLELAKWSTFLWAGFFIIAFGLLVERILGSKPPARVAILVGSFGTVWLQLHFAPQAASIGVTMLVIWVLLSPGVARTASAILMATWLAVSHPPSILFILAVLTALWVLKRWFPLVARNQRDTLGSTNQAPIGQRIPTILAGAAALWIAWMTFIATATLIGAISLVATYLRTEGEPSVVGGVRDQYLITTIIRVLVLMIMGCISIGGTLYLFWRKKERDLTLLLVVSWLVAAAVFALILYPLHLLDRAFMVFLPGAAISVGLLVSALKRSWLRAALVAVALVVGAASAATAYREASQYIVPFKWVGSSSLDWRFLNEYPSLPCSKPFIVYVDNFTLLWTAASLGGIENVNKLKSEYENGSIIYADGTTTGYLHSC